MTGLGLLWTYAGTTVGHRRLICRDFLAGDAGLTLIRDSIESLSVDSLAGTQKRTALDAISRIEGEGAAAAVPGAFSSGYFRSLFRRCVIIITN